MRAILILPAIAGLAAGQFYSHVVITAETHVSHFAPLCEFVETSLGWEDTIVTVEAIDADFPGRDRPERIRNFIRYAYDNWLTTYVLLGGDDDVVPCRYARGERRSGEFDNIPCDLYYAALDGNWDADGDNVFGEPEDSVDLYPDIYVGRFPVSSTVSTDLLVGKFLRYTDDPDDPYLSNVFLNGMDLYEWCLAEDAMEFYDSTLVPETMKPCVKVYDGHGGNHRDSMMYYLNQGQHIWVHSDHSNRSAVGAGWRNHHELLYREDMSGLTNGDDLSILVTNGCSAGAYDSVDCVTEYFLLAQQGGGVAAFANSRTGLLCASDPLHGQSFMQMEGLLRAFFGHPGHGELSDLSAVQALVAPLADTSARYRYSQYQFTLFGDPAMPVWIPSQSGVMEDRESRATRVGPVLPTIVRGVLRYPRAEPAVLTDITGRQVMRLRPGGNDVSGISPGVYFVRAGDGAGRTIGRIVKVREE